MQFFVAGDLAGDLGGSAKLLFDYYLLTCWLIVLHLVTYLHTFLTLHAYANSFSLCQWDETGFKKSETPCYVLTPSIICMWSLNWLCGQLELILYLIALFGACAFWEVIETASAPILYILRLTSMRLYSSRGTCSLIGSCAKKHDNMVTGFREKYGHGPYWDQVSLNNIKLKL